MAKNKKSHLDKVILFSAMVAMYLVLGYTSIAMATDTYWLMRPPTSKLEALATAVLNIIMLSALSVWISRVAPQLWRSWRKSHRKKQS